MKNSKNAKNAKELESLINSKTIKNAVKKAATKGKILLKKNQPAVGRKKQMSKEEALELTKKEEEDIKELRNALSTEIKGV